jgi:hypothetical protein
LIILDHFKTCLVKDYNMNSETTISPPKETCVKTSANSVKNTPNEIRISGPGTLNIIKGNTLSAGVAVSVHGPNGSTFPGEPVDWAVVTSPSRQVAITGNQNATVTATNVQNDFSVTVTVTARRYPALRKTHVFSVKAINRPTV